jgi:hypothetical protein
MSLLGWGHRSGLPRFASETPNEYGSRLGRRFPTLNNEIKVIAAAFSHEIYGEETTGEQRLKTARLAWQKLKSPVYWPARLRSLLLQPEEKRMAAH